MRTYYGTDGNMAEAKLSKSEIDDKYGQLMMTCRSECVALNAPTPQATVDCKSFRMSVARLAQWSKSRHWSCSSAMAEPLVRGLKRGRPRLPRAVDLETELPEDEDDEQAFAKRIAKITRPDLGVDYKIYLPHAQTFGQPDLPGGTFKYTTTLSDIAPELGVFFRRAHERGKEIRATKSNLPILWGLLGPSLSAELKPAPVPAPTMPKSCQTCCTVEADVWPSFCDTNMSVGLDRTWTDVDGLGGRGWTRMGGAYVDGRGGRGLTWADGAGVDGACGGGGGGGGGRGGGGASLV